MNRIALIFGTRPEAIKLLPLAKEMRRRKIEISLVFTSQHGELAECVFRDMNIYPDVRLAAPSPTSSLKGRYIEILTSVSDYITAARPSAVTVVGDTSTAHAAAVAAHLAEIPIYHVEAGLRTYDTHDPYPEEFFRRSITAAAELHFAPNTVARNNLLSERVKAENIFVTGNTVTDAIKLLSADAFAKLGNKIIFTMHRRENEPHYAKILSALRDFAEAHPELEILYPAHPRVEISRAIADTALHAAKNIRIEEPIPPREFYRELLSSRFVITDSGGIEEECAALGIPALVIRNKTERVYELMRGEIEVVGTEPRHIFSRAEAALKLTKKTARMKDFPSPSREITDIISDRLFS